MEKYPDGYIEAKSVKIKQITMDEFIKEMGKESSVKLSRLLNNFNISSNQITISSDSTGNSVLLTNEIEKAVNAGHTVYTLPVKLQTLIQLFSKIFALL